MDFISSDGIRCDDIGFLVSKLKLKVHAVDEEVASDVLSLYMLLSSPLGKFVEGELVSKQLLVKLFRAQYDYTQLLSSFHALEEQEFLSIMNDKECRVSLNYKAQITKSFIEHLLIESIDLSRDILALYLNCCNAVSSCDQISGDSEETIKFCFEMRDERKLFVESRNVFKDLSEIIWPASFEFCEQIVEKDLFKDKRVLELGSGVGLLGIACSVSGCLHVTMTDCSKDGMKLMDKNMKLNKLENYEIQMLDWSLFDENDSR